VTFEADVFWSAYRIMQLDQCNFKLEDLLKMRYFAVEISIHQGRAGRRWQGHNPNPNLHNKPMVSTTLNNNLPELKELRIVLSFVYRDIGTRWECHPFRVEMAKQYKKDENWVLLCSISTGKWIAWSTTSTMCQTLYQKGTEQNFGSGLSPATHTF
jgi:hypothetical protein